MFILNKDDKMDLFNQSQEKQITTGSLLRKPKIKKIEYKEIDFTMRYYFELLILNHFPCCAPCFNNGKRKRKMLDIA